MIKLAERPAGLRRRAAPALPEAARRVRAHDANDEVDDQPNDRDADRDSEKKQRKGNETLEDPEQEAEKEKSQHGQRADGEYGAKHLDELLGGAVSITRAPVTVFQPDVIVVGAGLIGLTCATAVARDGLRVLILSSDERGAASPASAGILAPSVGWPAGPARTLGITARDAYPEYVHALTARTRTEVRLDRSGVLEVGFSEEEALSLRSKLAEDDEWIDESALHTLEPALSPAPGATLHRHDGAVDSAALLKAVRVDAAQDSRISFRNARVLRFDTDRTLLGVELSSRERLEAPVVIVAAGAWVGSISGLPRWLPVEPVRGQILAFAGAPTCHVIMGRHGYVVRRGDRSLVGSTMERVGFDATPTADGAAILCACAREISPDLASRPVVDHWAGLRPVTPDLLPIVGADPEHKGLFYACGHSRNGVLLAPLTASVIAELVSRGATSLDVSVYAPDRFDTNR